MKKALAVLSLGFLALGCATMGPETRMFKGPFGRTEIGGFVVAADPGSSKILLQTYDGYLWVFDLVDRAAGRLGTLDVGDEINLAFDDRVAGPRVVAVEVVAPGRHPLPGGAVSVAQLLPYGVNFGAPAVTPSAGVVTSRWGTVENTGMPLVGTGIVGGTAVGTGFVGTSGVVIPGFGSFATMAPGMLTPQSATSLGLAPGAGVVRPMPGVAAAGGFNSARAPITSGNFTPGTVAPGVTTANPATPGTPFIQGPFTPGTVAPGVPTGTGPNAAPRVRDGGTTTPQGTTGTTTTPRPNQ